MSKLIQDIQGLSSAYIDCPFDEGKEALESQGYKIISLEENARLRMQEGKNAYISQNGNWTREGVLYVPNKGIFLTKNSPIMANAIEATGCHREGKEFYLTNEQVDEALTNSVQFKDSKSIPTNRFAEDERTAFAFGETAKVYGEFLKEAGIKEMPVYLASLENKSFARQAWLRELGDDYRSGLSGGGLYYSYAVRGVREIGLNNSENYTPEKISLVLKNLGFSGLEKNLLKELRK